MQNVDFSAKVGQSFYNVSQVSATTVKCTVASAMCCFVG